LDFLIPVEFEDGFHGSLSQTVLDHIQKDQIGKIIGFNQLHRSHIRQIVLAQIKMGQIGKALGPRQTQSLFENEKR